MNRDQKMELTNFFKLLGHETRLKLLGLLANAPQTAATLAQTLNEKERVILRHLRMLQTNRLVQTTKQANELHYALNRSGLTRLVAQVESDSLESEDEAMLTAFIKNGRLIRIPQTQEAQKATLNWLAEKFEPNQRYKTADVEAILQQHCRTPLSALRHLRDQRLLLTTKGLYWRPAPQGGAG